MENYKIYISKEGQICAILLPEEPKEVRPYSEHVYRMQEFERALFKAKQEAVPFKDQNEAQIILPSVCFGHAEGQLKRDTIWDFPIGYSVEVEEKPIPCPDGIDGCEVLHLGNQSTLKKTSPPLPVNTETTLKEMLYDKFEDNATNYFQDEQSTRAGVQLQIDAWNDAIDTEDEKGVDQKEELRKKFYIECKTIVDTTNIPLVVKSCLDRAFNVLHSEIEKRDKAVSEFSKGFSKYHDAFIESQQELASLRKAMEATEGKFKLQSTQYQNLIDKHTDTLRVLEAADEVIKTTALFLKEDGDSPVHLYDTLVKELDNYNKLKEKI